MRDLFPYNAVGVLSNSSNFVPDVFQLRIIYKYPGSEITLWFRAFNGPLPWNCSTSGAIVSIPESSILQSICGNWHRRGLSSPSSRVIGFGSGLQVDSSTEKKDQVLENSAAEGHPEYKFIVCLLCSTDEAEAACPAQLQSWQSEVLSSMHLVIAGCEWHLSHKRVLKWRFERALAEWTFRSQDKHKQAASDLQWTIDLCSPQKSHNLPIFIYCWNRLLCNKISINNWIHIIYPTQAPKT